MTREEMEAEANRLGVEFRSNIGDVTLAQRIEQAKSQAGTEPEERAVPVEVHVSEDPSGLVQCKVLVANLWTSKGKFFLRDSVDLPAAEAAQLDAEDKVVIK